MSEVMQQSGTFDAEDKWSEGKRIRGNYRYVIKLQKRPDPDTFKLSVAGRLLEEMTDYMLSGYQCRLLHQVKHQLSWRVSYCAESWEQRARRVWV